MNRFNVLHSWGCVPWLCPPVHLRGEAPPAALSVRGALCLQGGFFGYVVYGVVCLVPALCLPSGAALHIL